MKLSNTDKNGKFIKRGAIVSFECEHFQVQRVRQGKFWAGKLNAFGKLTGSFHWLVCEQVQIIKK